MEKPIAPDLQEWIAQAGAYDLVDWAAWDRAWSEYLLATKDQLAREMQERKVTL